MGEAFVKARAMLGLADKTDSATGIARDGDYRARRDGHSQR